jgi:hypothetical protein
MYSEDYPGREIFRVSGRVLVWVETADVHFMPLERSYSIPLFTDEDIDSGRFMAEMDGWLSIPQGSAYKLHETGEPFTSLQFPERITAASL